MLTDEAVIKFICTLMLTAAGSYAGYSLTCAESRRASLLADTMDSFQILRIHMLDSLLPLNAAFGRTSGYILNAAGEIMNGISASEAWNELKSKQCVRGEKLDSLTPEDKETLNRFFLNLGRSSREEQEKNFETTLKELGILESAARKNSSGKKKLYISLGALAGNALAIVLL